MSFIVAVLAVDNESVAAGRYFGNSAQFWLNMQSLYDLSKAQQLVGAKVEKEVEPLRMTVAA